MALSANDRALLTRCVDLAEAALNAGDQPFGSLLVDAHGSVLLEAVNRANTGDPTQHPEFEIARWAAQNLTPEQRAAATVYTSGEHCPMCSAAHGWAGLGRIVYGASAAQLGGWLDAWQCDPAPVRTPPITHIINVPVDGPAPELADRLRELHARARNIRPPD